LNAPRTLINSLSHAACSKCFRSEQYSTPIPHHSSQKLSVTTLPVAIQRAEGKLTRQ